MEFDLDNFNPLNGFQEMINEQLEKYNDSTVKFIKAVPLKEGEAYSSIMLLPREVDGKLKMVALLATFDKDGKHIRTLSNFDLQHLIKNLKIFSAENLIGMQEESEEDADELISDTDFEEMDELDEVTEEENE